MKTLEFGIIVPFGEYVTIIANPKLIFHGIKEDSVIDIVFYLDGKALYHIRRFQVYKDKLNVFSWGGMYAPREGALVVDAFGVFPPGMIDISWELSYSTQLGCSTL